jgi:hypothetical protein
VPVGALQKKSPTGVPVHRKLVWFTGAGPQKQPNNSLMALQCHPIYFHTMSENEIGSRNFFHLKIFRTRTELKDWTSSGVYLEPSAGPARLICGYDADNFLDPRFWERIAMSWTRR